jgi:hypothetical protein
MSAGGREDSKNKKYPLKLNGQKIKLDEPVVER